MTKKAALLLNDKPVSIKPFKYQVMEGGVCVALAMTRYTALVISSALQDALGGRFYVHDMKGSVIKSSNTVEDIDIGSESDGCGC